MESTCIGSSLRSSRPVGQTDGCENAASKPVEADPQEIGEYPAASVSDPSQPTPIIPTAATPVTPPTEWYAIKTRQDLRAERELSPLVEELFFPKETVHETGRPPRVRPVIPRVLFVRTDRGSLLDLERRGREHPELSVPFWIYRYPRDRQVQVIPPSSIRLLRLLTADDPTRCEIFTKSDFRPNQHVRITGGPFAGYEGYVQRVRKNRHVIVRIEGICMIMLPFIHPDLLQPVE